MEGYLLTNNHVVEGASDIEVQLTDGRQTRARLIGTDPETDLAVLKVDLERLPVMAFGHVPDLQVGDVVLAIGNPFNVGQTVTSGIVSALGRNRLGLSTFENFIQTDASINPGNSGGALVDLQGSLVGINTAIFSNRGGNTGIGFAIPVDTARQVLDSLVRTGEVQRGWLGVEQRELTPEFARSFGVPGLAAKRPDLRVDEMLGDVAPTAWEGDIAQCPMSGLPSVGEVAFLHRGTRTLLLTDACFNIHRSDSWLTRVGLRLNAAWQRFTPSRLFKSFIKDREALRVSIERILEWDFDRVVVAHGDVLERAGRDALREAYRWMGVGER